MMQRGFSGGGLWMVVAPAMVLLWLAVAGVAEAQGTKADYERAASLGRRTQGGVINDRIAVQWIDGGRRLRYRIETPGGEQRWMVVDTRTGRVSPAPNQDRAADEPAIVIIDPQGQPGTRRGAEGAEEVTEQPEQPDGGGGRNGRPLSPDERWVVTFDEHNARLRERGTNRMVELTADGTEELSYRGPVYWSPDSRFVVFMRRRAGGDRRVYYVASSPSDQLQPRLQSYKYLKPGDPVPQDRPVMFEAATGREIEFDDALFDNPWSIRQGHWSPDGREFRFLYNQRGHQVMRLVGIGSDGTVRTIIDETADTFIDYSQKAYLHPLPKTDEVIWGSERDGWNHLYLIDARTGEVRNPITSGQWVVRGVERVDEQKRQILFRASGIIPGQDPYHIHYARVNFDGSGLVLLTEGDGTHELRFSPDGESFIDAWSRVDLAPVTELRRTKDGSLIAQLAAADASALESAGIRPERFTAKGRDGETDIWGVIWRPTNFDPAKKYPVIEKIYAGPHGAHVPKSFRRFFEHQRLAELGFIIVQIDGMGTNHRGKAFHDVAWKNLADAGFADRKLWIRAAAEHEPAIDLSRVGIYGGSAGGQNAMRALLDHHDLYKAAVADCGCHDNRLGKAWWSEAWMGWPVDEAYERSSNVVDAHKLEGKLLLMVGEADRNVDPAQTMQAADALIRANKDFELLIIPGRGHIAAGSAYGRRRLQDFFVRALWEAEPRR